MQSTLTGTEVNKQIPAERQKESNDRDTQLADSHDDGQPFLFATVPHSLVTSHSVDEIDRVLDADPEPIPYNDTGDVWTFENVPEEAARRTSVIRTSFPCYGCTAGLWDGSFEPNVEQELVVTLDDTAVCHGHGMHAAWLGAMFLGCVAHGGAWVLARCWSTMSGGTRCKR
jgi:hypothetical protein